MAHPELQYVDHRPWPLPPGRWTWRQSWRDLLFAHWPVPVAAVRALVPPGLEVDTFDGATWLGIVPFRMAGVMRRPLPDLPWISAFPELNVRVYVTRDGRPGVWFLSLDATNPVAVAAARLLFHLPYYRADMTITATGDEFAYRSLRRSPSLREGLGEGSGEDPLPSPLPGGEGAGQDARPALIGRYRPTSTVYLATPGTLEHWLTERYCLYALAPGGALYRCEVHHRAWPLQRAEAEFEVNTVSAAGGLPVSGPPTYLHFSRRQDVVIWSPRRLPQE
ncbi:MAG: DUF2071 domain-containing protein [Candidatus Promineofilum sp.]|nr:DUF2071 domain-containing protein [Promineifilum sp.]MCW5865420.1 DUF2071 domain-containing protein [Anaerolineae bacterium]